MTAQSIKRHSITELPSLTALQTALLKSRVKILDEGDVQQYQKEMLAKVSQQQKAVEEFRYREEQATLIRHRILTLLGMSGCFGVGIFVGGLWPIAIGTIAAAVFARAFCLWMGEKVRKPGALLAWRWYDAGLCSEGVLALLKTIPLPGVGHYGLPKGAVSIAKQIAATGVAAKFELVHLDNDPFLRVVSGENNSEGYYVAVWDEAGFHA